MLFIVIYCYLLLFIVIYCYLLLFRYDSMYTILSCDTSIDTDKKYVTKIIELTNIQYNNYKHG